MDFVTIDDDTYNLICPNPQYPHIGDLNQEACCYIQPRPNFKSVHPDEFPTNKIPMMASAGFIVYVPHGFRGNYVMTRRFRLIPGINGVVVE